MTVGLLGWELWVMADYEEKLVFNNVLRMAGLV
jgi:hypothetical protein